MCYCLGLSGSEVAGGLGQARATTSVLAIHHRLGVVSKHRLPESRGPSTDVVRGKTDHGCIFVAGKYDFTASRLG